MVEAAMRGVVRESLARTAASGLPGTHHFYISFRTHFPGVRLPDYLVGQYPDDMTIVIEHQFWDLEVEEDHFAVTLSFQSKPERLVIPFEAITAFTDPSVKFALQFQAQPEDAAEVPEPVEPAAKAKPAKPGAGKSGEVVTLDAFRKK
jgi:hypothetical protein